MTGGVSLAIWMGGLTCEINRLVQAGLRQHEAKDGYLALKELLDTDVTVDVICGTSAGGINGAALALAVARNADLSFLRNMWLNDASLAPGEPATATSTPYWRCESRPPPSAPRPTQRPVPGLDQLDGAHAYSVARSPTSASVISCAATW